MKALSQSPFLQALGYAIANSLWQIAILWIIVVLLNSLFTFTSQTRYRLALLAQMAGFAWFLFTLRFYYSTCSESLKYAAQLVSEEQSAFVQTTVSNNSSVLLSFIVKTEQLLPYLSVAYLLLLIILSVNWLRCYTYTQSVKTTGLHPAGIEWEQFIEKMSLSLGLRQYIRVYLSGLVKSPLTIGFIKPVILIPVASINHLTTEQLEAVILHELAHIKRADYLVNLIQSVIEISLFFNPFTQLLGRLIKKEREHSCDDWVLQFQYDSSMYAEALLRMAYLQTQGVLAMQATGPKGGDLLHRVKRMLYHTDKVFNYRQQLMALLLMTGILSSVAWFQPVRTGNAFQKLPATANKASLVMPEPLTATVDNPFFNPAFFLNKPLQEEVSKVSETVTKSLHEASEEMKQAHVEVAGIAPAALESLAAIHPALTEEWANISKEAKDELRKANVSVDNLHLNRLPGDSTVMGESIRKVFDGKKLSAEWQKVQKELMVAKNTLSKLAKNNTQLSMEEARLNVLFSKAFADLVNINFTQNNAEIIPAPPTPPAIEKREKEIQKIKEEIKQQKLTVQLREINEQLQKADVQNKNAVIMNKAVVQNSDLILVPGNNNSQSSTFNGHFEPPISIFNGSSTSPKEVFVYSVNSSNGTIAFNKEEDDSDNEDDLQNGVTIQSFPAPAAQHLKLRQLKKRIHIVSGDKDHQKEKAVDITIEIN